MSIEARIARHIYEEVRAKARENKSVRLPLRIAEYQRLWPGASRDQILRAHLIVYELLIQDVAEAVSTASDKEQATGRSSTDRKNDEGREP